jgi:hypothetical protein
MDCKGPAFAERSRRAELSWRVSGRSPDLACFTRPPRDQAAAFRPSLGTLCWRFEPKAQPERHLQDFKGDKV